MQHEPLSPLSQLRPASRRGYYYDLLANYFTYFNSNTSLHCLKQEVSYLSHGRNEERRVISVNSVQASGVSEWWCRPQQGEARVR